MRRISSVLYQQNTIPACFAAKSIALSINHHCPTPLCRHLSSSCSNNNIPLACNINHHRQFSTNNGLRAAGSSQQSLATSLPSPLILHTQYTHRYLEPPTVWIESLKRLEEDDKVGLMTLSPCVWFQTPQIDMMHTVIEWQETYRKLLVAWQPVRSELKGGTRKPWPQKGTGRARFKDTRGPGWHRGGVVWGHRGPRSYYYMLPMSYRVRALISALSIKLAQDDLHIVDSFNSLPSKEPAYLEALAGKRNWGLSVLFVDDSDIMPENIAQAAWELESFTLMPVYGLNVYSILKHETLVMTVAGVQRLEEKLRLWAQASRDPERSEKDKTNNITK